MSRYALLWVLFLGNVAVAAQSLPAGASPAAGSAAKTDSSTGSRIEALRRERDELKRRHTADARRLQYLDVEEKLMEAERQVSAARAAKDDRKLAFATARQGRLQLERSWLEESASLEQQIEAAKDAGDAQTADDLSRKLKGAREEHDLSNVQWELEEARSRVRDLEERLAELTAKKSK